MFKPSFRELMRDLVLAGVLLLIAEALVRAYEWPRFWALLAAFGVGHCVRAAVRHRRYRAATVATASGA